MSVRGIKSQFSHVVASLTQHGFVLSDPLRAMRSLRHMNQFVEIQIGRGWLAGKFSIELCWKYTLDGVETSNVYDQALGIGALTGGSHMWLSHESPQSLQDGMKGAERLLLQFGIPFLDSLNDLRQLLRRYEDAEMGMTPVTSEIDPRSLFGRDEGWKHYNLGFAYRFQGESAKALAHFSVVIERHSHHEYDWVQARMHKCQQAVKSILTHSNEKP